MRIPKFALLLLALQPALASAQDPQPSPSPTPQVEVSIYSGAMHFISENGANPDHTDFVTRLSATVQVSPAVQGLCRADLTRTQDGGNLLDVHTFQSIELLCGARIRVTPVLSILPVGGVTWNRDSHFNPRDPRLWTGGVLAELKIASLGKVAAGVAQHGPVGGIAFLATATYYMDKSGVGSYFVDSAVPLNPPPGLPANPFTIRYGIALRTKRFLWF